MKFNFFYCLIFSALIFSCGDDESKSLSTDMEGIYSLTEFKQNLTACSPAASDLSKTGDKYFYLKTYSLFGTKLITLTSCPSQDKCKEFIKKSENMEMYALSSDSYSANFTEGSDENGFKGIKKQANSNFKEKNCAGSVEYFSMEVLSGSQIQVTKKAYKSKSFEKDSKGFCSTKNINAEITDSNCNEYLNLKGTRVTNL